MYRITQQEGRTDSSGPLIGRQHWTNICTSSRITAICWKPPIMSINRRGFPKQVNFSLKWKKPLNNFKPAAVFLLA
jgi:hypothetical protein